jgi:hypothetical protein
VTYAVTEIFDDASALADAPQCEDAIAVNARISHLEERLFATPAGLFHTAIGALIAAWKR